MLLPAVVGSVVLNLSTESSEIFWRSQLRREEPSAGFLVVIGSGKLICTGRVWSATYISINLFLHSISLLFWWIQFSSTFSVKLANPASARFLEGPVLSFLPFSQRCIVSSENNHYPPFPQTACSCVFKQNNNLLTHLLILSANIPLGCSKPPLNFHPSHPERAFESFFSPFARKPSGD